MSDDSATPSSALARLPDSIDVRPFTTRERSEIVSALFWLLTRREVCGISTDATEKAAKTAILAVDEAQDAFWFELDDYKVATLLDAPRLLLVAQPGGVKIQLWVEGAVRSAPVRNRPAVRAPIPTQLVKFQRRSSFRSSVGARLIRCRLPAGGGAYYEVPVHNLSVGGMSLRVPRFFEAKRGDILRKTFLDLADKQDPVTLDLEVRHVYQRITDRGDVLTHVGVKFVAVRRGDEVRIERWIAENEREKSRKSTV
jgi:c-di-GMP-binding flagellar brake protein YcgR